MSKLDPLFSSASAEWETPNDLFDQLWDRLGPFDLDPCCLPWHYTAQRVLQGGGFICTPPDLPYYRMPFGAARDGLAQDWTGKVYMNPPYGREIGRWVEKAVMEVMSGRAQRVVGLLPARPDTRWWQHFILSGVKTAWTNWDAWTHSTVSSVYFLPGRLRFVGAKASAPFPSALVVWGK